MKRSKDLAGDGGSDIAGQVQAFVNERLGAFFEQNPPVAKRIINKAIDAARGFMGRNATVSFVHMPPILLTDVRV